MRDACQMKLNMIVVNKCKQSNTCLNFLLDFICVQSIIYDNS
jgi:hypothetical protein